jgi:hypothetical protein
VVEQVSLPVTVTVGDNKRWRVQKGKIALCLTKDDGEKWSVTTVEALSRAELVQARDAIDAYLTANPED